MKHSLWLRKIWEGNGTTINNTSQDTPHPYFTGWFEKKADRRADRIKDKTNKHSIYNGFKSNNSSDYGSGG